MKRAEPLTRYAIKLTLCKNPRCLRYGKWKIEGEHWCGTHAGQRALEILRSEEAVS